jgi:glycine/D-amino acid oxidase-like deaminating enzyme
VATAYFLGKAGIRATIVEADAVASGASGAAAGLLSRPSLEALDSPLGPLLQESFNLHLEMADALAEESGVDFEFARSGMLRVALTEEEERSDRRCVEEEARAGLGTRWLDGGEVRDLCGWIDLPIRGALCPPPAARLDAYRYSLALLAAAERMGATLRTGRVTGVVRSGDRLVGVEIGDEVIDTETALFAMGPWSADAAGWLGVPIPVEPLKGQIVHVRTTGSQPDYGFGDHGDSYAAPKGSGLVFLGTTEERAGFDAAPTTAARDSIIDFAVRVSQTLGDAEIVDQTACLRPLSPDRLPILDAAPSLRGAYVATGHGRQGVLLAPASGREMARLMRDERPSVDLSPFSLRRFDSVAFGRPGWYSLL